MGVNYVLSLKSSRMQDVIAAIDANGPGILEVCTAGFATVLVAITLANPSFTEADGVISLAGAPLSGVAAANGSGAVARIKDGLGTTIVNNLTVGTSNADFIFNSTAFVNGQTVTVTGGTITHAA